VSTLITLFFKFLLFYPTNVNIFIIENNFLKKSTFYFVEPKNLLDLYQETLKQQKKMETNLKLEIQKEAIEVYRETELTPKKLLSMYRIAVNTLQVNLETMKFMFSEEQKLQEKLSQQSEKLEKLVNQSDLL
jgi:hypothetical protein